MRILRVFCVYDTIGNRCFEKTSFPKTKKKPHTHIILQNEQNCFSMGHTYYKHIILVSAD